jgi:quercetin dioxygenase-like cupin family protein
MKKGLIAAAMVALAGTAYTGEASEHARELTPADINFTDDPAFPKGAQSMLIHGDPSKPEFFIIRLKFPPNYIVPAHTHPALESVTVLTGSMGSGMGEKVDITKGKMLDAGSLLILPGNHPHYVWTGDEETIIQVAANGPFDIIYVNPEEDPRKVAPSNRADR